MHLKHVRYGVIQVSSVRKLYGLVCMWVKEKNSHRRKQNGCRKGDIQYFKSATLRRIVSTSSGELNADPKSKSVSSLSCYWVIQKQVLKNASTAVFFFVIVWSNVCILKIKERGKISKVSITQLSALTDSLLARKLTHSNKQKVCVYLVIAQSIGQIEIWSDYGATKKSQLFKVVV